MNNTELEVLAITKRMERLLLEGVLTQEDVRHLSKMAYSFGHLEGMRAAKKRMSELRHQEDYWIKEAVEHDR